MSTYNGKHAPISCMKKGTKREREKKEAKMKHKRKTEVKKDKIDPRMAKINATKMRKA